MKILANKLVCVHHKATENGNQSGREICGSFIWVTRSGSHTSVASLLRSHISYITYHMILTSIKLSLTIIIIILRASLVLLAVN